MNIHFIAGPLFTRRYLRQRLWLGLYCNDNKLTVAELNRFPPGMLDIRDWREFTPVSFGRKLSMKGGCQRGQCPNGQIATPCRDEALEVAMATLGYMGRALIGSHVCVEWHRIYSRHPEHRPKRAGTGRRQQPAEYSTIHGNRELERCLKGFFF